MMLSQCVSVCEKKKRKRRTGWQQSQGMAEVEMMIIKHVGDHDDDHIKA